MAVDRLVYAMDKPEIVTTVCSSCVSAIVLIGIAVGVFVVAVHDLWVYSITIFGNCGVDELPTADGDTNIEAVVWPWINVVLFDVLPLIVACGIFVPLVVTSRRFRRSAPIVVGGDGERMAMIYAALATLIIYIVSVLPTSVFRLTMYYRPPLFAAPHELVAYYTALTTVSLINCVHSGTLYIAFFAAVPTMRGVVSGVLYKLRRTRNTTANSTAESAAFDVRPSELETFELSRLGDAS